MTTTDPITAYQESLRNLETKRRRAEELAAYVVDAGRRLQSWRNVRFSNLGVEYPVDVDLGNSILGDKWPDGLEVAQALADWHKAKHAALNAWRSIPNERKLGVQPPPD